MHVFLWSFRVGSLGWAGLPWSNPSGWIAEELQMSLLRWTGRYNMVEALGRFLFVGVLGFFVFLIFFFFTRILPTT